MKAKSILLGMCLLAPLSFAKDLGWFSVQFGGEVQGLLVSDSWHTRAIATSNHLDAMMVAVTNAGGYSYQEAGNQLSNYTLGGRVTVRTEFETGIRLLVALGLESGMKDANGYRPIDPAGDSVAVTVAEWDAQATTAVSKWKNKTMFVPAVYVGIGSLSFGVGYDQREFVVSGHDPALTTYLDGSIKDSQYIYGIRAEQIYEFFAQNVIVSFEFMTNLGKESEKNTKEYFQNLAKYGMDAVFVTGGTIFEGSGVLAGGDASVSAVADRAKVNSVNTNLTKISVGVGMEFVGD